MSSGEVRTRPPSFRVPSVPGMPAAKGSQPRLDAVGTLLVAPSDLGITGVAARAATIECEGYFEALGLPEGASIEAVRAAYFRLAKLWHPDRVPPELATMREEIATVMGYLTRAHGTLTDPETRDEYIASRKKAKENEKETRPRAQIVREIEALLGKKEFAAAEMEAKKLRDANPDDADAVALVAWTAALGGDAPEDVLRASLTMLDRAVYGDRFCDRAYYYRGVLHKKLGDTAGAFRDFSRVVAINPKHVDAQREVRLHEMRARKGSGEHILSLFTKTKK
jgi:curved DNA-binding protein CbpA